MLPKKDKKRKAGRKSQWPARIVDDLVDIILDDEKLKEKLLMINVTQYYQLVINEIKSWCENREGHFLHDLKQTREKFKRCIAVCREASLKIKTASGIQ